MICSAINPTVWFDKYLWGVTLLGKADGTANLLFEGIKGENNGKYFFRIACFLPTNQGLWNEVNVLGREKLGTVHFKKVGLK